MNSDQALELLRAVAQGAIDPREALHVLALDPAQSLPFATVDRHRALRQGFPEVIYGAGKTLDQVVAIAERIAADGNGFLATRLESVAQAALQARFPAARINETARTVFLAGDAPLSEVAGPVAVVTAGTSEIGRAHV